MRAPVLVSFWDHVILPLFKRLHEQLTTHRDALSGACPRAHAASTTRARVVALMGGDAVADRVYARPGPEGISGEAAAARAARPDRDASPPATFLPVGLPDGDVYRANVRHQQPERERSADGAAAAAWIAQSRGWWGPWLGAGAARSERSVG